MRVATYNIKHAALKGLDAIAAVLQPLDADLIGLQEVDVGVRRSGAVDQPALLGSALGRRTAFGPALAYDGGHYGIALLSRWPIRRVEVHPLPSLVEARTLLLAEVDAPGGRVRCGVTHLGLDPTERMAQARELRRLLAGLERLLVVGDFNASHSEPALAMLTPPLRNSAVLLGAAPLRSYPSDAPAIGIDHILVGLDLPEPRRIRAVPADASDHLPVVADLG